MDLRRCGRQRMDISRPERYDCLYHRKIRQRGKVWLRAVLQLKAARELQAAAVDQQAGGAGTGWYPIVTAPGEADAVISAGQSSVVLGLEVDYLFGSYPTAILPPMG